MWQIWTCVLNKARRSPSHPDKQSLKRISADNVWAMLRLTCVTCPAATGTLIGCAWAYPLIAIVWYSKFRITGVFKKNERNGSHKLVVRLGPTSAWKYCKIQRLRPSKMTRLTFWHWHWAYPFWHRKCNYFKKSFFLINFFI